MAIKRCKHPFVAYLNGRPRVLHVGDLVDEDDPVMRGRTHMFEDVEATVPHRAEPAVEQATAEPGERRSVTRPPAKKTAAPAKKTAAAAGAKKAAAKEPDKPGPKDQEPDQGQGQGGGSEA